jgi:transposase
MSKRRRCYAPEFRCQMVELMKAGRSPEELAREFEPTAQSIRNWVAQAKRDAGRGDGGLTTAEREELNRLRRENRQLRLEREILSKAAAWFARETNAIPAKGSGS